MSKSRSVVTKEIRKAFPDLFVKPAEQFDGRGSGGLWTSGETGVFQYWNHYVDPKMQNLLDKAGWYYEYYDAGTVMLYKD